MWKRLCRKPNPLSSMCFPPSNHVHFLIFNSRPPSPVIKIQHKFRYGSPNPDIWSTAPLSAPSADPLGPTAQHPYLSGNQYSCRPGGPRLFDLLSPPSLKSYGVLSWMIVDREEEIYELDDMRDEDKIILVLWNRWIFLNRSVCSVPA